VHIVGPGHQNERTEQQNLEILDIGLLRMVSMLGPLLEFKAAPDKLWSLVV
jgi:hypothetical protein